MSFRSLVLAPPILLLAACGGAEEQVVRPESDPAMTAALNDPLMTDPDLVTQNRANHVARLPGGDGSIPAEDASPQTLAAARGEALALVGGPGRMKAAPKAREAAGGSPPGAALTAAARVAASSDLSDDCAEATTYTAVWAAKMPEAFPVYPRAAVQEAAGTDAGGCSLRAVNFTTPVPPGEVIDFYYTRARHAGFSARPVLAGGKATLGGRKGARSFAVHVRGRGDGTTEVDLVANGR